MSIELVMFVLLFVCLMSSFSSAFLFALCFDLLSLYLFPFVCLFYFQLFNFNRGTRNGKASEVLAEAEVGEDEGYT